jgi:rubrerythrin
MEPTPDSPVLQRLSSLFDLKPKTGNQPTAEEALFYTCPQCGHPMVTKKCKIVCYTCHYFIGCVE